jgi:ABC-2 type transport system ATP-binding protein
LTDDVRVDYGDTTAVRDLSFAVGPGEVVGLIGPNGAGKTSTIRVLATLLEPTYGRVEIGGYDPATHPAQARAILGYMPDLAPVHDDLTCWEFLDAFAGSYGLRGKTRKARVDECLSLVQLEPKRKTMAGTLSRGMTQRLVLAKTLLHRPAVMLLDEPASGLDPLARAELRDLLNELSSGGVTVLISSHILTELSGFCTMVGIMERGRLKRFGRLDELTATMRERRVIQIELLSEPATHAATIFKLPRLTRDPETGCQTEGGAATDDGNGQRQRRAGGDTLPLIDNPKLRGHVVTLDLLGDDRDAATLLKALIERGLPITGFAERKPDIEDLLRDSGATEVS